MWIALNQHKTDLRDMITKKLNNMNKFDKITNSRWFSPICILIVYILWLLISNLK